MPLGFGRSTFTYKAPAPASGRDAITVSAFGNAQLDTAQQKFGSASALFDGTGDYLRFSENVLGEGAFTIEFFFRPTSIGTLRPIWWSKSSSGANDGGLYINSSGGLTWWNPNYNGSSANVNANAFGNLSNNTWYHIACVYTETHRYLFVNGTGNSISDINVLSGRSTDVFEIGQASYNSTVFTSQLLGHLDEIRVSDTARYTSDFTAPSAEFSNDADTTLLLHCDGTDGSTTFTDTNT